MYPNFICIGALKSGSSWLYHQLKSHPQVWLPPIKQIEYFSTDYSKPIFYSLLIDPRRRRKLRRIYWVLKSNRNFNSIIWVYRYFFKHPSDDWYKTLFNPEQGQISGDMSPQYGAIQKHKIEHISRLVPDAKIIYTLRNPILRAWSEAAMYFRKRNSYNGIDHTDDEKIMDFLEKIFDQSCYTQTISKWECYFDPANIHIGFFEHLKNDPVEYYKSNLKFLGLDCEECLIPKTTQIKFNSRSYGAMSPKIFDYLKGLYTSEIRELHKRFNNIYTDSWIVFTKKSYQEYLETKK